MIKRSVLAVGGVLAALCAIGAANPRRPGDDYPIIQNIPASPSAVLAVPDPTAQAAARPVTLAAAAAAAASAKAPPSRRAALAESERQDETVIPISAPNPDREPAAPPESVTATQAPAGAADTGSKTTETSVQP